MIKKQMAKGINRWVVLKRMQIALGDHRKKGSKKTDASCVNKFRSEK